MIKLTNHVVLALNMFFEMTDLNLVKQSKYSNVHVTNEYNSPIYVCNIILLQYFLVSYYYSKTYY